MVNIPLDTPSRSSTNWTIPQPRSAGIPTFSRSESGRRCRKELPAPFRDDLDDLAHPMIEPYDHPETIAYDRLITFLWDLGFAE